MSSFLVFAKTCEAIRSTSSKLAKISILAEYLRALEDEEELAIVTTFLSGRIFPPGYDEVNVGYSLIWRAISELFNVNSDTLSTYYRKHGDLGSVFANVIFDYGPKSQDGLLFPQAQLEVKNVLKAFKELSSLSGKNSTSRKQQTLTRLFSSIIDPLEAKFLVRILTGEMRIGLVEGLVEESIAKCFNKTLPQVRSANLVCGNIAQVAVLAKHDRLNEAKITPLQPTNFMLADSAENALALFNRLKSVPVFSEFKYDGIRAQVHLSKGRVRIFSRNLEDVTIFFPEIGKAVSQIEGEVIFDGEIVPTRDGRPLSFQLLQKRLRKTTISADDVPVRYFAFDVLYRDRSLIQCSLEDRVKVLKEVLPENGILHFSDKRKLSSAEEIQTHFVEAKTKGFEGLVVKDPASLYTPGKRGGSWVKLKKELDTLDVVIVAAEYGHGKRAGVISDYTFAVRSIEGDLKVIGKAYSGLTDIEILEMTKRLKEITLKDEGYRRFVKPEVVLEVAFDAIQKSERHDSGYALRFPRIKRIRTDKSVREIDSLTKVEKIFSSQIHNQ
jgi:DNA ligase-1